MKAQEFCAAVAPSGMSGGPRPRSTLLQANEPTERSTPTAIPPRANFGEPKLVIGMKWNETGWRVVCKCLNNGGQGRNRTAAASLFRAVRSITYEVHSMKTKELRVIDLDSIWTPVVNLSEFRLQ